MKNRRSCKAQLRTLQLPFLHIMRCLDDKVTIRILIAISHHMYIGEFLLAFELIIFPIIISICLFLFFHKIMLPLFQCHTLLYSNNYILQHPNMTFLFMFSLCIQLEISCTNNDFQKKRIGNRLFFYKIEFIFVSFFKYFKENISQFRCDT